MIMDDAVDYIRGWLHLLSGIWGLLLAPVAIAVATDKKTRIAGIALIFLVGISGFIFIHDIHSHFAGKRPWIPFYEFVFGLAIPVDRDAGMLAHESFSTGTGKLKVEHVRRGNYAVRIWIPETMQDFSPIGARIGLCCRFSDKNGNAVLQMKTKDGSGGLWTRCRGARGGSHETYCKYRAPDDVPLDEELTLEVIPTGETEKFAKTYPFARITVEKCSDK